MTENINYTKRILICNDIAGKNIPEIGNVYRCNWVSKDGKKIHLEESFIRTEFRLAKINIYENKKYIKSTYYTISKDILIEFIRNKYGSMLFKTIDVTNAIREHIDMKCRNLYGADNYNIRNEFITHRVIVRLIKQNVILLLDKKNNRKVMKINSEVV